MRTDLGHLHTSLVHAVTILRQDTTMPEAQVDHALAILRAALSHWRFDPSIIAAAADSAPEIVDTDDRAEEAIDDIEIPPPRSLSDYRRERGMTILAFGDWLGIAHFEYAGVIHRLPVDRRLRDQIAYKLGVAWQAIAEFMPERPPQPRPQPVPIPAPDGTPPPDEPWYLFDDETGYILSGPHNTSVPENGFYLSDPLAGGPSNLVVLHDFSGYTEEQQLPPEGFSDATLRAWYPDWYEANDADT